MGIFRPNNREILWSVSLNTMLIVLGLCYMGLYMSHTHERVYSQGINLYWSMALVKTEITATDAKSSPFFPPFKFDRKESANTDPTSQIRPHTYLFLSWWHSSTLKHLPYFLFNRMSRRCLILTPKYQLASRMNGTFPLGLLIRQMRQGPCLMGWE